MRELQTCDFCGADPVGVYEPLPARLASDQPRVALCADCRDTLRRVLAPLDGTDAEPAPEPEPASDPDPASAESDDPTPAPDESPSPDDSTNGVTIDASDAAGSSSDAPAAERPPGYRNVLRLVRNRDEPLARDDLEALVSSAYDMSAADVRQAVDAAVENGDLRETDGGLRA